MGKELKWDTNRQKVEITKCLDYMRHFGGSRAARLPNTARISTISDVTDAFKKIDNKDTGIYIYIHIYVYFVYVLITIDSLDIYIYKLVYVYIFQYIHIYRIFGR
jgi:hypothetical protein